MAEREQPHNAPYPSGEVARDVRKMEEREGITKRDMLFRDTIEKCRKRREIRAPIKKDQPERTEQPAVVDLKCSILEFGVCLYKGFDKEIEKDAGDENTGILAEGFHSFLNAMSSSPRSPANNSHFTGSNILGVVPVVSEGGG